MNLQKLEAEVAPRKLFKNLKSFAWQFPSLPFNLLLNFDLMGPSASLLTVCCFDTVLPTAHAHEICAHCGKTFPQSSPTRWVNGIYADPAEVYTPMKAWLEVCLASGQTRLSPLDALLFATEIDQLLLSFAAMETWTDHTALAYFADESFALEQANLYSGGS